MEEFQSFSAEKVGFPSLSCDIISVIHEFLSLKDRRHLVLTGNKSLLFKLKISRIKIYGIPLPGRHDNIVYMYATTFKYKGICLFSHRTSVPKMVDTSLKFLKKFEFFIPNTLEVLDLTCDNEVLMKCDFKNTRLRKVSIHHRVEEGKIFGNNIFLVKERGVHLSGHAEKMVVVTEVPEFPPTLKELNITGIFLGSSFENLPIGLESLSIYDNRNVDISNCASTVLDLKYLENMSSFTMLHNGWNFHISLPRSLVSINMDIIITQALFPFLKKAFVDHVEGIFTTLEYCVCKTAEHIPENVKFYDSDTCVMDMKTRHTIISRLATEIEIDFIINHLDLFDEFLVDNDLESSFFRTEFVYKKKIPDPMNRTLYLTKD
jgi:hypothetical protein